MFYMNHLCKVRSSKVARICPVLEVMIKALNIMIGSLQANPWSCLPVFPSSRERSTLPIEPRGVNITYRSFMFQLCASWLRQE